MRMTDEEFAKEFGIPASDPEPKPLPRDYVSELEENYEESENENT